MLQCTPCPDNSYSYEGASSCIPCAEGTAVNEDKTFCGKTYKMLYYISSYFKTVSTNYFDTEKHVP